MGASISSYLSSTPALDALLRVECPDGACRALGGLFQPQMKPLIMFVGDPKSGKSTLVHGLCSLLDTRVTFITKFHDPDDLNIIKDSVVVILEARDNFPTKAFLDNIRREDIKGVVACGIQYPPELDACDFVSVFQMLPPLHESERKPSKDLLRALLDETEASRERLMK